MWYQERIQNAGQTAMLARRRFTFGQRNTEAMSNIYLLLARRSQRPG
jgi:hypothetical protein